MKTWSYLMNLLTVHKNLGLRLWGNRFYAVPLFCMGGLWALLRMLQMASILIIMLNVAPFTYSKGGLYPTFISLPLKGPP